MTSRKITITELGRILGKAEYAGVFAKLDGRLVSVDSIYLIEGCLDGSDLRLFDLYSDLDSVTDEDALLVMRRGRDPSHEIVVRQNAIGDIQSIDIYEAGSDLSGEPKHELTFAVLVDSTFSMRPKKGRRKGA